MPVRDDRVDRQTDFWKESLEDNRGRIDLELKLLIQEIERTTRLHTPSQCNDDS